jgi:hypothetical protein
VRGKAEFILGTLAESSGGFFITTPTTISARDLFDGSHLDFLASDGHKSNPGKTLRSLKTI